VPLLRYTHTGPEVDPKTTRLGRNFTLMSDRGVSVARFCQRLRAEGYVPDVIYGHSGWGETLFLKEVWPEAKLLLFCEFYYRGRGTDTGFDPEFQASGFDQVMIAQSRAAYMAQALVHADKGVSPTEWQASTHPPLLRQQIEVIFDGVDCDRLAPNPEARFTLPDGRILKRGDEVLTFVNRNLEPYRGYHIFMRALPDVLAARPDAQVVIVGGNEISYGHPPKDGGSWKDVILDEVKDRLDLSRVHFTGRLPYDRLVDLMHVARVHAYLTYPFVLSWSMVEAMAAGTLVVGSDTPPVAEVIRDGVNGRLVDFFDVQGWSAALIDALARPEAFDGLRAAARQTVLERYDLRSVCLPKQVDLLTRLHRG
jgi:glycosyltransferase involved in cell wall biosynthesis